MKLTEQEQRIAIAEACGWKWVDYVDGTEAHWESKNHQEWREELPNYLHDLNAMHEAWTNLGQKQKDWFGIELGKVLHPLEPVLNSKLLSELCNATAAQRAEAFLRTIGKWVELESQRQPETTQPNQPCQP